MATPEKEYYHTKTADLDPGFKFAKQKEADLGLRCIGETAFCAPRIKCKYSDVGTLSLDAWRT